MSNSEHSRVVVVPAGERFVREGEPAEALWVLLDGQFELIRTLAGRETVTAGGSSLHYDDGQYVYVWKTEKSWKNTCRELTLKLMDNRTYRASFRFK